MADLADVATSARDTIGRYFSVVSLIPSALLVVWIFLLVTSGAWSGSPNPSRSLQALGELGVGGSVGLVLAAIALGLLLHPVQYGMVQVLEGYWGAGSSGRRAFVLGLRRHSTRRDDLEGQIDDLNDTAAELCSRMNEAESPSHYLELQREWVAASVELQQLKRVADRYPEAPADVMP